MQYDLQLADNCVPVNAHVLKDFVYRSLGSPHHQLDVCVACAIHRSPFFLELQRLPKMKVKRDANKLGRGHTLRLRKICSGLHI